MTNEKVIIGIKLDREYFINVVTLVENIPAGNMLVQCTESTCLQAVDIYVGNSETAYTDNVECASNL